MAYEDYEGDIAGDAGYDVVGAVMQAAQMKGVRMLPSQAVTIAKAVGTVFQRPVVPRPIVAGRKTGMTTGLPLGTVNIPTGTLAGALFQLLQINQERFVARRFTCWRGNIWVPAAATPSPVATGQAVTLLNLLIGQRSVLAGGAGTPVEMFDPRSPGSGLIAGGVEVPEGKAVTAQFQWIGPGAVAAAESVNVGAMLHGEE